MISEKPVPTILSIQYARALAALLVVFAHAHDQLRVQMPYNPKLGHIGVDLFFVISGFIMVVISERKKPGPATFMLDRIQRIVPNYWFYTTVVAALAIIAPQLLRNTDFEFWHYVQSLLFIVHERPGDAEATSPLLRLGWTLNYEMFFYLIFALAMLVSFRRRIVIAAIAITFLVVAGRLLEGGAVMRFYTGSIMLEFVAGMIIGAYFNAYGAPSKRFAPLFWLVLAGALAWANAVMWDQSTRGLVYGIPAAIVIFLALSVPASGASVVGRVMKKLGDASYTIYLFHLFPLAAMRVGWNAAGLPKTMEANIAFVVLALLVVSISGVIAYELIERRLAWFVQRIGYKRTPVLAAN